MSVGGGIYVIKVKIIYFIFFGTKIIYFIIIWLSKYYFIE
jgi:hypothetical protein